MSLKANTGASASKLALASPTQELVDSTLRTEFAALPEAVVRQTKRVLLDLSGCALAGHVTAKARIVKDFVEEMGGKPQAAIIGAGRTSWAQAAFANAELMNAVDFDPMGPVTGHVAAYVVSPCLALAEREKASGKDLITAVALSLEIGGRILTSLAQRRVLKAEPPYYDDSPRFSFSPVVFGGVAGAGKLLRLDREKLANAMGIAGASTPVPASQKWEHTPAGGIMVKYNCWAGWIAQLAASAALLAARGFTGDTTILDGEWGFWKIIGSPFFEPERLVGGLGQNWHFDDITFRPYPCCTGNQTGIDAINQIVQENAVAPDDIQEIVVKGAPALLCPNRSGTELKQPFDTQFINTYIFAVAAYHGRHPGPEWQSAQTINDPRISSLMKRVGIELHPGADELTAGAIKAGAAAFRETIVEITARGRKFTARVEHQKGSPRNPMTDDELKDKFRNNARYSGRTSRVEEIIETIDRLEDLEDARELMGLLSETSGEH